MATRGDDRPSLVLDAHMGIQRCLSMRNKDRGPVSGSVETYGVLPACTGNTGPRVLTTQPGTTMSR